DGADARTRLEAALVKAAAPEVDPAARALMARVERLEAALSGGATSAERPRAAEPPPPAEPPRAVPQPPMAAPQRAEAQPAAPAPSPPSPPSTTEEPGPAPAEAAGREPEPAPAEAAGREPEPEPSEGAGGEPERAPAEAARREPERAPAEAAGREPEHAPAQAPTAIVVADAEPDLDAVRSLWPAVLDAVRADNGLLAACLAEAHPVEVRGSEVVVAFAEHDTFNRKMADGREHRATVDDALRGLAGSSLRVVFE